VQALCPFRTPREVTANNRFSLRDEAGSGFLPNILGEITQSCVISPPLPPVSRFSDSGTSFAAQTVAGGLFSSSEFTIQESASCLPSSQALTMQFGIDLCSAHRPLTQAGSQEVREALR
jgi:hypothetical protein